MTKFGARHLDLDLPSQEFDKSDPLIDDFRSKSNPATVHEVRRTKSGDLWCTCPAFKFQKKPVAERSCKHTRAVAVRRGD